MSVSKVGNGWYKQGMIIPRFDTDDINQGMFIPMVDTDDINQGVIIPRVDTDDLNQVYQHPVQNP
jgi:hypothetical protein